MSTLTPEDRARLRDLASQATSGPWEAYGTTVAAITGPGGCRGCSGLLSPPHEPSCYWSEIAGAAEDDTAYIAAADPATVTALLDALDAAEAELDRLHSWAGLMELLDEHYPADLIPTAPDNPARDTGPRIVSLIRRVDAAEAAIERVREWAQEASDFYEPAGDTVLALLDSDA